jgi:hypothetical protein
MFYFGEHASDSASLSRLAESLTLHLDPDLEGAATVGLALQACYLSTLSDKAVIYAKVINALATARCDEAAYRGRHEKYPMLFTLLSYFYVHESLGLSALPRIINEVRHELTRLKLSPLQFKEAQFWLLCGVIEVGDWDTVRELVNQSQHFEPNYNLALTAGMAVAIQSKRARESKVAVSTLETVQKRLGTVAAIAKRDVNREADELRALANETSEEGGSVLPD